MEGTDIECSLSRVFRKRSLHNAVREGIEKTTSTLAGLAKEQTYEQEMFNGGQGEFFRCRGGMVRDANPSSRRREGSGSADGSELEWRHLGDQLWRNGGPDNRWGYFSRGARKLNR